MSISEYVETSREYNSTIEELIATSEVSELIESTPEEIESQYEEIKSGLDKSAFLHNLTLENEYTEVDQISAILENMIMTERSVVELEKIQDPIKISIFKDEEKKEKSTIEKLIEKNKSLSDNILMNFNSDSSKKNGDKLNNNRFKSSDESREEILQLKSQNIQLLISVKEKTQKLREIHSENQKILLEKSKFLKSKDELDIEIEDEKLELEKMKVRTSVLSELITALVISPGINWSVNDEIKDILMYCGEDYLSEDNESLQSDVDS